MRRDVSSCSDSDGPRPTASRAWAAWAALASAMKQAPLLAFSFSAISSLSALSLSPRNLTSSTPSLALPLPKNLFVLSIPASVLQRIVRWKFGKFGKVKTHLEQTQPTSWFLQSALVISSRQCTPLPVRSCTLQEQLSQAVPQDVNAEMPSTYDGEVLPCPLQGNMQVKVARAPNACECFRRRSSLVNLQTPNLR